MDRHARQTAPSGAAPPEPTEIAGGFVRVVLALVIIELTAATATIHFDLGGPLFTLDGFGYVALAAAYAIGALAPIAIVQRFAWLPRLGLAGYALVTIGAYVVVGSYFALGWITKGIELAIVGLLVADMLIVYGSPRKVWRAVLGTSR
ncbi:MAG TPA: hypothetical protein VGQ89_17355 [Candidatus Limnocylindrales bacterium]|nr:hypothetical protein [Candidatus Limnocylindrales bacterium]